MYLTFEYKSPLLCRIKFSTCKNSKQIFFGGTIFNYCFRTEGAQRKNIGCIFKNRFKDVLIKFAM